MRPREGRLAGNVEILNLEILCAHLGGGAVHDSVSLTRHERKGMITFEHILVLMP